MGLHRARGALARLVSVCIICMGFAQGLSSAELLELEGQLDSQVAGGDVVAIVGVVFIVLLILELVGVTDIFKSF